MAITIKTEQEIELLREGGKRHALIMQELIKATVAGISTGDLDALASRLIQEGGDKAAFLGYKPYGAKFPYPASLCVSINDEVVHGIPSKERVLQEGDIVSLDLGLVHQGMYTDMAVTIPVGTISPDVQKLLDVGEKSLTIGIKEARGGGRVGDISFAIEQYVIPFGFGIVEELAGHGVGYSVHEDPYVPNYGDRGQGPLLKEGMVLAIEPILNLGSKKIVLGRDGYTYKTKDGKLSVHFEHTVLITKKGVEILTKE